MCHKYSFTKLLLLAIFHLTLLSHISPTTGCFRKRKFVSNSTNERWIFDRLKSLLEEFMMVNTIVSAKKMNVEFALTTRYKNIKNLSLLGPLRGRFLGLQKRIEASNAKGETYSLHCCKLESEDIENMRKIITLAPTEQSQEYFRKDSDGISEVLQVVLAEYTYQTYSLSHQLQQLQKKLEDLEQEKQCRDSNPFFQNVAKTNKLLMNSCTIDFVDLYILQYCICRATTQHEHHVSTKASYWNKVKYYYHSWHCYLSPLHQEIANTRALLEKIFRLSTIGHGGHLALKDDSSSRIDGRFFYNAPNEKAIEDILDEINRGLKEYQTKLKASCLAAPLWWVSNNCISHRASHNTPNQDPLLLEFRKVLKDRNKAFSKKTTLGPYDVERFLDYTCFLYKAISSRNGKVLSMLRSLNQEDLTSMYNLLPKMKAIASHPGYPSHYNFPQEIAYTKRNLNMIFWEMPIYLKSMIQSTLAKLQRDLSGSNKKEASLSAIVRTPKVGRLKNLHGMLQRAIWYDSYYYQSMPYSRNDDARLRLTIKKVLSNLNDNDNTSLRDIISSEEQDQNVINALVTEIPNLLTTYHHILESLHRDAKAVIRELKARGFLAKAATLICSQNSFLLLPQDDKEITRVTAVFKDVATHLTNKNTKEEMRRLLESLTWQEIKNMDQIWSRLLLLRETSSKSHDRDDEKDLTLEDDDTDGAAPDVSTNTPSVWLDDLYGALSTIILYNMPQMYTYYRLCELEKKTDWDDEYRDLVTIVHNTKCPDDKYTLLPCIERINFSKWRQLSKYGKKCGELQTVLEKKCSGDGLDDNKSEVLCQELKLYRDNLRAAQNEIVLSTICLSVCVVLFCYHLFNILYLTQQVADTTSTLDATVTDTADDLGTASVSGTTDTIPDTIPTTTTTLGWLSPYLGIAMPSALAIAVATLLVLNAYESTPPTTSHAYRYVVLSFGVLATTTLAATAYYCYAPRGPKLIPQQGQIREEASPSQKSKVRIAA